MLEKYFSIIKKAFPPLVTSKTTMSQKQCLPMSSECTQCKSRESLILCASNH